MTGNKLKASVIVNTYNKPNVLNLVLLGLKRQTTLNFEVLIADDGSTKDTAELIANHQKDAPFPMHHIWHEDLGNRRARILNRSIEQANTDYIILLDGDCIPHFHLVQSHLHSKKSGYYLYGKRVLLGQKFTENLKEEDVINGHLDRLSLEKMSFALKGEIKRFYNGIFIKSPILIKCCQWFSQKNRDRGRGFNLSMAHKDLLEINGFNEDLKGWGRDDDDLLLRLEMKGLKGISLRFQAIVYHLYHPLLSREHLAFNDRIIQETIRSGIYYCRNGIVKVDEGQDPAKLSASK